nr:hypothetical protein [Tanacetum cinerariifolium]
MPITPTPPSPTTAPSPPPQDPTPTPHASPPHYQPSLLHESTIPLLTTLMKTCASLSYKVAELEQDKHTQALEILKLKKRVKKLENKRRLKHSGFKRLRKGRITQEDVSAVIKDVSTAEPTVFDVEEWLHDEEVKKAAARDKQEKDNLERAQVLQKQYDEKEENIAWNAIVEQVQKRHLDNIKKGMTYDKVRPIFEREYKKVQTLFKPDKDVEEPKKKRVAEETLLQESFKKLKAVEVSEKDYPLSNAVMTLMLSAKLQVEEDNEMARDLVMKIFMETNKPKSKSLDTSSK